MMVTCPQCQKTLNVADSAAGRQGQCPSCQHVFMIPASQGAPAPAGSASSAPPPGPVLAGGLVGAKAGGLSMLKLGVMIGAFLMFLSFFLPWWGIDLGYTPPKQGCTAEQTQKDGDERKELGEVIEENGEFYDKVLSKDQIRKLVENSGKAVNGQKGNWSGSAFGFDFGRGVVSFIFGLLVLALVTPLLFVKFLQKWAWTVMLPAAVMGLVCLILALTVWIGTPGKDVSGATVKWSQGVSIGPFIAMPGAALMAAAAALDGAFGLIGFIRGLKK